MPASIELPPPPDISRTLRYFRSRGMFCDVRLRFSTSSNAAATARGVKQGPEVELLAHRVVLAAASPFFADQVEENMRMPTEMSVDAMRFLLCWMYNDVCKIELSSDRLNLAFLERLRLGARLLVIPDLERFIEDLLQQLKTEATASTVATTTQVAKESAIKREVHEDDFDDDEDDDDEDDDEGDEEETMPEEDLRDATLDFDASSDGGEGGIADGDGDGSLELSGVIPSESGESLENESPKKSTNQRKTKTKTNASNASSKSAETKLDRRSVMTIPCEKCGRKVRRGEMSRHHAFFHSDLAEELAVDQLLNPPKDDPILTRHLIGGGVGADGVTRFQCSLCEFSMAADSVPAKADASSKDLSSSSSSSASSSPSLVFRRNCAKHLYSRHSVICPTLCFPCPKPNCDTVMWSSRSMAGHLRRHDEPKTPRKACNQCGILLAETSLKQHIQLVHAESQQLPCPSCNKVFRNAFYLKCHQRVHAPPGEKEFSCQDCDGEFQSNDRLKFRHHVWSRHGKNLDEGDMFNCPSCDYKTPVESIMRKHIKDKHLTRVPNVACPQCDKIFRTRKLMENHAKRVHGDGDGRKCDICGADFRSQSGFNYHLWRVHKQGKNGSVKDDKHFRFERPYKCPYCSHTSGLSGNMRKHVMNVHKGMAVHYLDLRTIMINDSHEELEAN